jgi:hypothetical protein
MHIETVYTKTHMQLKIIILDYKVLIRCLTLCHTGNFLTFNIGKVTSEVFDHRSKTADVN